MAKFSKLKSENILPVLAAAAAIRNIHDLLMLIDLAKSRNIKFKKIYETLLQNYLFTGYPSALVSLKILKSVFPNEQIKKMSDMNLYHFKKVGAANCKRVYGKKYDKLINNIKNFSPDISEWLVLEGYGKVLGRKGLSFKERELCIVAVLTVLKFEDQLYSHINGAFRAKASIIEINNVIKILDLLGRKKLSAFGLQVLKRFKEEKGI